MADRPHYIATTNRTVIVPTSVKPKAPLTPTTPNQSGDEVLKYIREKAKHAADYYSSVGLANGDLIRSPHSNSRPKRRSASPEKFSRVSSTWNQPTAPSPSRYGANWVKVRPHTPNRETDPDSYTRPLSTGSTRPDRSQSRSKSTSLDFTALAAGKDTGSAESGASRNVFSHVAHLPAYLIESDRGTGSLERRSRAPTKDERVKSSSLTRMGKPAHFHADNGEGLKDVPRVSSHLHDSVSSFAVATPVEQQGDSIKSAKVELSIQYSVPVAKTPVKNGTSARPKDAEHRRRDRDLSKMKTEIISSSFDSANSLRPSVKSRGFGSASSLDQALANGLNLPDVEPMDLQSKSLPPSTKHIKKQKLDSRDSSAANSASGSPLPLRKHKDKSVRSKSDIPDHKVLITKLNRVQSEKDVVDGFSYEPSFEDERRRRHHFAHYDWQSMMFSFKDVLVAMENLKRKNTATGASKAAALAANNDSLGSKNSSRSGSVEDVSIEEDAGFENNSYNDLVASCPFFRNEIGGEPDRMISFNHCHDNHSTVFVQVGDSVSTEARNVLANHTFLSVVEGGKADSVHPPGAPPSGSVVFGIEKRDEGARYYRQYFFDKDHQNFFGIDDRFGPIVVSLRREKIEENGMVAYQYRVIVRTSELCTLRGSILEEAIHHSSSKHASAKGLPPKEVIEYVCPEINASSLKFAVATPKVHEQLVKVDEQNVYDTFKIGVLYCRAGQTTEEEMYNNESASPVFEEFLQLLGQKVKLHGFSDFRGGLDVKTDSTGTESVFTEYRGYKIMFHVSTMLPFTPNNKQQLLRKRHIGNDIMTVVFQEPGSEPFSPKTVRSHFQHVFIIVRAYVPAPGKTYYRVAVTRSRNIPRFGPAIPEKCMFVKSATFREFLLTKIINGENTAHVAGKFKEMAMNTRQEYLRDLCLNQATQAGLEGSSKFAARFSISAASRRIRDNKEKQRNRPTPELLSRGALTWAVTVFDHSLNEAVPCLLGISDCALTMVEVATKQLIFGIPCQAVLGWSVPIPSHDQFGFRRGDLLVYYGRGERVTLQTDDIDSRDEIVQRLERFTKGSETTSRQLRRNAKGELGFHVNYEGIVMDVDPNECAFQDGVTQSSRLVEICKVLVATMTHEEIIDLLRTSKVVKVVMIRPHEDGTPRKCSKELYHLAPIVDVRPLPDTIHERSRSEPARSVLTAGEWEKPRAQHHRADSCHGSAPKQRIDADPTTGRTKNGNWDSVAKRGTRKERRQKDGNGECKATLLTAATKLAVMGSTVNYKPAERKAFIDSNSSASNTMSSTKSTASSHSGADVDLKGTACSRRCGVRDSFLHSASSLSTDSGLNSNNNSSSTLSKASTDTATVSSQLPTAKAPFPDHPHDQPELLRSSSNPNASNNNNNTFPGCYGDSPRRASSNQLRQGDPIIRGVQWNPKPKSLGLNASKPQHAYTVECTPTSEVNHALRVYVAGSEAYKQSLPLKTQTSAPVTPCTDEPRPPPPRISNFPVRSSDSLPHHTPIKWKNLPAEPLRTAGVQKDCSPRPKRRTVHGAGRLKNGAKPNGTPLAQSSVTSAAPNEVQDSLIRLLAGSPTKPIPAKRSFSPRRTSPPIRSASHRVSPDHKLSPTSPRYFPSGSPPGTRGRIPRTHSDESLCGARTDHVLHARQENFSKSPVIGLYDLHASGSVDSLATSPIRSRSSALFQPPSPDPSHSKPGMLPLPVTHSWDRLLDAAKAAEEALTNDYLDHFDGGEDEVFEAASTKSVSMGTLTDVGRSGREFGSPQTGGGRALLGKRTVSMESLYDHEYRGNQGDPRDLMRRRDLLTPPPSRPSLDLDETGFDYTRSVLTSESGIGMHSAQPSESEQRLEKIERELRSLQEKLRKEQESKKRLEKEVTLLRRDNTRLQRHAFQNSSETRHKRPKRKSKT